MQPSTRVGAKREIPFRSDEDDSDPEGTEYISLNFFSTADSYYESGVRHVRRTIRKVRFWHTKKTPEGPYTPEAAKWGRFKQHKKRFQKEFKGAMSLEEYVLGSADRMSSKFEIEEFEELIRRKEF